MKEIRPGEDLPPDYMNEYVKLAIKEARQYSRGEFIASIENTFAQGIDLIRSKNDDYATGSDPFQNFREAEKIGLSVDQAIMVSLLDKVSRLANCIQKGEVKVSEETINDTILDLINYSAILKAWRESK